MIGTVEADIAADVQHAQEQGLGSTGNLGGFLSDTGDPPTVRFERCGPPRRGFLSMDPLNLNLRVYGPLALGIQACDEGRLE